jgi:hypothetical protein
MLYPTLTVMDRFASPLAFSVGERLAWIGGALVLLWLGVAWALGWFA